MSAKNKELNSVEKLHILLQPYIRKREIKAVLQCSAKKAADIFDSVLLEMKQKNYSSQKLNTIMSENPFILSVERCDEE